MRIGSLMIGDAAPMPSDGDMDFTHPDFAMLCARTHLSEGAKSWFYTSTD
ncbi:hypothetical protein [Paenibacillus koleovorans]|nr:hypothetical protein [Paenibacillus koleovorans]